MGCSGCGKKRATRARQTAVKEAAKKVGDEVMGGYKYLNDAQIKARLEVYKKRYCSDCDDRYECTYETYTKCVKRSK